MFDSLAASLNISFKWLSMFDLDQAFLSNILLDEQIFDRLASSASTASLSGKSNQ